MASSKRLHQHQARTSPLTIIRRAPSLLVFRGHPQNKGGLHIFCIATLIYQICTTDLGDNPVARDRDIQMRVEREQNAPIADYTNET